MEKYIYDNNNGLWYELQGDYLTLDGTDIQPIGIRGRKHLRHIKKHRPGLHTTLLIGGKLNGYLAVQTPYMVDEGHHFRRNKQ